MALFKVVTTTASLEELAREISSEIASLLSAIEQTEDSKAKVKTEVPTKDGITKTEGITLFELPWTEKIGNFASELSKAIVKAVQRLVEETEGARIRKTRPNEYQLPPAVFQAGPVSQQGTGWLATSEHEIAIIQSFHDPNDTLQDAKLRLQSDLTRKDSCEIKLQHGSVILVFGSVRFLPVPLEIPFLMLKLPTEPAEHGDVI